METIQIKIQYKHLASIVIFSQEKTIKRKTQPCVTRDMNETVDRPIHAVSHPIHVVVRPIHWRESPDSLLYT